MSAKFGPAGNSEAFSTKYKTTLQAPGYLEAMGLDHYEYQCGRGVKVSDKIAFALKDKAKSIISRFRSMRRILFRFQALKLKSVTTA